MTTYISMRLMLRSWCNLAHKVARGDLDKGFLRKHFSSKKYSIVRNSGDNTEELDKRPKVKSLLREHTGIYLLRSYDKHMTYTRVYV